MRYHVGDSVRVLLEGLGTKTGFIVRTTTAAQEVKLDDGSGTYFFGNQYIERQGRPLRGLKSSEGMNKPDPFQCCEPGVEHDPINNPAHYNEGRTIEPIQVVKDWGLGYLSGNALKYLSRYDRKGNPVQDLKKARWYIDQLIAEAENNVDNG